MSQPIEHILSSIIDNKEVISMERPFVSLNTKELMKAVMTSDLLIRQAERAPDGLTKMVLAATAINMLEKIDNEIQKRQ